MAEETLERMISSYMSTEQPVYSFGWQGGEPTLMGASFFRLVTELQRRHGRPGVAVSNGLQTNGTLITDEMAAHLAEFKFLVGVSVDGPADLHDRFRMNAAGAGTHASVMRGIEILRRHSVDFNTLTLVTQANARRGAEVYDWLVAQGFLYHQYIPCVEFMDDGSLASFSLDGESWGRFLCDLFDAWYTHDTRRVSIRLFDSLLHKIVDDRNVVCHLGRDCRQYFVVEHDGGIYPCDFFVRSDLRLGGVADTTWEQALDSQLYRAFGLAKCGWNENCRSCKWLGLCSGDCLKHRPGAPEAPANLSVLCTGLKMFFEHAAPRLNALADAIRTDRRREEELLRPAQSQAGRNDLCPCGSGRKFKKCCGRRNA
jgi:uncharacterized protein